MAAVDPVALTQALVRAETVTPDDGRGLDLIRAALEPVGFRCERVDRGGVANLYARWGTAGPVLGFNGHTDVVPTGDPDDWTHPPFSGDLADGALWGRGSVDMKSGVAAFTAAAAAFVTETPPAGSVALLITGDEEGLSVDGTRALLDWMEARGERLDACIVGEPTSVETLGDAIKIGRRGSMNVRIAVEGVQGHTAYPDRANNPAHALIMLLNALTTTALDEGSQRFSPSTLQVTTIDIGNPATNVIPARATAALNIRFNDHHSGASLTDRLNAVAEAVSNETGARITVETHVSGESFFAQDPDFIALVENAVESVAGIRPERSTGGGTSDARFVKDYCPVVEVGLVGKGMHAVDERAQVSEIETLTAVYRAILSAFFSGR
jgi:succinyl-diaminopimelate desuccinylase